jgi:hypothetical protein
VLFNAWKAIKSSSDIREKTEFQGVPQFGRGSALGAERWRFKSSHPDDLESKILEFDVRSN